MKAKCPLCDNEELEVWKNTIGCDCGLTWTVIEKEVRFISYDDRLVGTGTLVSVVQQFDAYNYECIVLFEGKRWSCLIDPEFTVAEGYSEIE